MPDITEGTLLPENDMGLEAQLLSSIPRTKQKPEDTMSANDILSYTPVMTDQEKKIYDNIYGGNTGALSKETYFPSASHNINVGSSSGRYTGTHPVFAPSTLFPMGVFDAREKALNDAAALKAKKLAELNAALYTPPQTKDVLNQGKLNESFYNAIEGRVGQLKQTYGDKWTVAAERDPSLVRLKNNFSTVARQHDYIIDAVAQVEKDAEKSGYVVSPQVRNLSQQIKMGLSKIEDANNPYDLQRLLAKLHVEQDLDKKINDVAGGLIAEVESKVQKDRANGIYDTWETIQKKYYPDANVNTVADQVFKANYGDNNTFGFTSQDVRDRLRATLGTQVTKKVDFQNNQFAPKGDGSGNGKKAPTITPNENKTIIIPLVNSKGTPIDGNGNPVSGTPSTTSVTVKKSFTIDDAEKGENALLDFQPNSYFDAASGKLVKNNTTRLKGRVTEILTLPVDQKTGQIGFGAASSDEGSNVKYEWYTQMVVQKKSPFGGGTEEQTIYAPYSETKKDVLTNYKFDLENYGYKDDKYYGELHKSNEGKTATSSTPKANKTSTQANSEGTIKVKRKSDGKVGTMPASKFDSSKYEKI